MTVYSHSRLNTFENCPQQYKFRYIDRIKRDFDSIEAFLGKRFHEVMELLYSDLNYQVHTVNELLDYYEAEWDRQMHPEVHIIKEGKMADDYREVGRQCIRSYYEHYFPFKQAHTIGLEHRVSMDLFGDGKYRLIGFIDRIAQRDDGIFEIHDYKTSGSEPKQKYLDMDRQLALYQIAVGDAFKEAKNIKLIWHYVVFDQEIHSTRTPQQLEALKVTTSQLIDKVEVTTEFPPKESRLCDWCAYQDLCPAKAHLFKTDSQSLSQNDDDVAKLVDRLVALAIKKKKLQIETGKTEEEIQTTMKQVTEVTKEQQDKLIDGNTHTLEIIENETVILPEEGSDRYGALVANLKRLGLWQKVAKIDSSILKELLLDKQIDKRDREVLEGLIETLMRRSFSLSKKKPTSQPS